MKEREEVQELLHVETECDCRLNELKKHSRERNGELELGVPMQLELLRE